MAVNPELQGRVFPPTAPYLVGREKIREFSRAVLSTNPINFDVEAAKASGFGQILVNSTFTFSLLVGLSVGDTTLGTLVANLGFDKVVTPKPVFIGDTLRAYSEVKELRESKSRPDAGIVTWVHEMWNQRDEVVCRCERSALIRRRG